MVCHGGTGRILRGCYAQKPPEVAMHLKDPQDELYRLHDGRFETLKTGFDDAGTSQ